MNILKGEATFPLAQPGLARTGPARSHAVLREAALMVLADTSARGSFLERRRTERANYSVTSCFLEPEADMTDISQ